MALVFNITAADKFFLGEDKVIDAIIYGPDNVTPLDVSGMVLEWNMRQTDKAPDPAIITKGLSSGLSVIGIYDVVPGVNTQRVRTTFASADTDPLVTVNYTLRAGFAYRHSLKRMDPGNEGILYYGSLTFLQATER